MENGEKCAFGFEGLTSLAEGLTKREYFAAMALQGICSNPDAWIGQSFAVSAVKMAENLLEELDKTK
jgi:hypothetical protein